MLICHQENTEGYTHLKKPMKKPAQFVSGRKNATLLTTNRIGYTK